MLFCSQGWPREWASRAGERRLKMEETLLGLLGRQHLIGLNCLAAAVTAGFNQCHYLSCQKLQVEVLHVR